MLATTPGSAALVTEALVAGAAVSDGGREPRGAVPPVVGAWVLAVAIGTSAPSACAAALGNGFDGDESLAPPLHAADNASAANSVKHVTRVTLFYRQGWGRC